MRVSFGIQSYLTRSEKISVQRTVNCHLVQAPGGAKGPVALTRNAGMRLFAEVGAGPIRGLHQMDDDLYCVSGAEVYRVPTGGASSKIGDLPGSDRVTMADNGTQIAVVSDRKGWIIDGNGVNQITDSSFPDAVEDVAFLDGYFVWTEFDSKRFLVSGINDGFAYNALDYASAEAQPDNVIGVLADHNRLMLAGTETMELWYNAGGPDFPMRRAPNGVLEFGCASGASLAKGGGRVFWLGNDRIVRQMVAGEVNQVSTDGVDEAIWSYSRVDDSFGFVEAVDGRRAYVLVFPTDEKVWGYDLVTGLWHERESYGRSRWRGNCYAFAYGLPLIGDAFTNKLHVLDPASYTESGEILRASATAPPIHAMRRRMTHSRLEVEMEVGQAPQVLDPQIMLDWSDDDGQTWSHEHWTSMGKIGEYKTRPNWHRLGQARSRIYRFAVTDPVPFTIIDAQIEAMAGAT